MRSPAAFGCDQARPRCVTPLRSVGFAALAFVMVLPALPSLAADEPEEGRGASLTVPDAVICTDVQNREPIGAGSSFPATVDRLFAFTRIAGATDPTHVSHVWFHEDREVHRMQLSVGGPSWRTWSYKTIPPGWTGSWRVDVEDAGGVIIYSLPFTVIAEGQAPDEAPSAGQQPDSR